MESVQKLDNMRMQRNNIANASSTSLSSSSCASVTEESASESHLDVIGGRRQLLAAGMSIEVEEKDGERFQSDACNKKFTKDCRKRRPLTVLKSQNVHCTCARPVSVSEDATSFPKMKPQSIPRESVVLPKSEAQMNSQTSDPVDDLPVKKKSSRRSQKEMSDFPIDDLRQPESRRDSKRTAVQHHDDIEQLENDLERKLQIKGKGLPGDLEDSGPRLRSDPPSPSFTSSRKSRKQNKNKGPATSSAAQRLVKSPSQGSTGGCCRASAESAPNGGERQFAKTPSSKDFEFSNRERKNLDLLAKEKRLKQIKVDCGRLNGCKQPSGVAELDTFEIASLRKKLQKKRCTDIPSSEALNELDGFDDPIVATVRRHSNESLGTIPASPELAEKWIEVNRKVKRIVVPSSALVRILGPDGSKLEAICNFTKAHIEQERTGNTKEITFIIRGTLDQMQAACSMISALTKDCDSQDVVRNGCTMQAKPELAIPLEKIASKPEARNSTELKTCGRLQRLPVVVGNASGDRINSVVVHGQRPDEEYQESVKSGVSERSNEPSSSERSSPDQDLLIVGGGEYSLFEHGLGQPLEKLLACKDSAKQTFAHAAGSRSSSQTLTLVMPDNCAIDQTLLAKAPGYRNVKSFTSRDMYYPKAQNGRMAFPWRCGGEQLPGNDASLALASHLLPVTSRNFSIPLLERPISAPTQPLPHSAVTLTFGASPSTPPAASSLAVQAFSKLNPNAPDFIFASSAEVVALNPLGDSHPIGSLVDPSLCGRNGMEAEYPYVPPFARNGFKPSAEILESAIDGTFCQGPPHLTSEETLYSLPVGDGLGSSWIRSQESWNMPKVSFGVVSREHASANTYPSRGDAYRGYFTHPVLATSGASPYNCVFYQQQQNMMLAPVQSWLQGSQTLAQAGP